MKVVEIKDHRGAQLILRSAGALEEWAQELFACASVDFGRRRFDSLHSHINEQLVNAGWPSEFNYILTISSRSEACGTGPHFTFR